MINNKKGNQRPPSRVVPALKANLARISSRTSTQAHSAPKPPLTLPEAEALLRSRTELLPAMILKDVLKLRDHTRYFLMTDGHADIFDLHMDKPGGSGPSMPKEQAIHDDLKQLLDEIAEEEGLEEQSKQEVWDDVHARKVGLVGYVLSLESEDLLCWCEVLLTDIIRGSTEDDRSGGTRIRYAPGAQ